MKMTVTTKELLDGFKTIKGSLNTKKMLNTIISNVCIKVKDYYIELVATDSNSLTMVRINPDISDVFDKDLIGKEFIFELDKLEKVIDKNSKVVELEFNYTDDNNKNLIISNNGLNVTLPSVQGKYPQYEQLLPYQDSYDQIKRSDDEVITIGMSRKLLLDILKSYDSKSDDRIKFEIPKDNYKYIGIQPYGLNSGKKYTMLMPVVIR